MVTTMKFTISTAAAVLAVASLCATEVAAQSKPDIRIATGRPGGAYFTQGAVLAEALESVRKLTSTLKIFGSYPRVTQGT